MENPNDRMRPPKYSDFLKEFAKKDPVFAQMVHNKLADLVKLAKDVSWPSELEGELSLT